MTKALFRKQMQELFNTTFRQGRRNKNRSIAGTAVYTFLILFVLVVLGRLSYSIANLTCETFVSLGSGWGYFAVMGIIATAFGVMTSVFSIFTTVYQAKDNELLLSMPITPRHIVLVRLMSSYILCFIYELVVMLPVYLVYWKTFTPGIGTIVLDILILVILPSLALFVCCVLGWLLAALSTVLTEKIRNIVNFGLTFVFVILFFHLSFKASTYMESVQNEASQISLPMRALMFPFMKMGMASQGDAVSFVIFAMILIALFALIYFILSASFIKLATSKKSGKKSVYKEKTIRSASVSSALFRKEFHRYRSSASYFMNSSLGSIIMLILFVLMLLNWNDLERGLHQLSAFSSTLPILLSCEILCFIIAMNTISSSSISMEGANLWILQSSPVKMKNTLRIKLGLHFIITCIPLLMCSIVLLYMIKPAATLAIMMLALVIGFALFSAELGLAANLLFPKMDWVSESNAVRHSAGSRISLFGSWAFVLAAFLIYNHFQNDIGADSYLLIVMSVVILLVVGLYIWLMKRGSDILAHI